MKSQTPTLVAGKQMDQAPTEDSTPKLSNNINQTTQHQTVGIMAEWAIPKMAKVPREIRNLVAGGLAGMLAKSVVAPIDRIKILFQVTQQPFRLSHVPHVGLNIIQHEGASALWRGNSAMMIRVFPYSGIQFMVFDKCKSFCLKRKRHDQPQMMTPIESLLAGSLAGVISVFFTYPLDLTRAQLAVYFKKKSTATDDLTSQRPSFISTMGRTYTEKGIPGLYRGLTPTVLGILPYAGVAFSINEQSKSKIRSIFEREPTTIEKMIIGGLAGLIAQTITYPLEVTRRRMQTHGLVSENIAKDILSTTPSLADPLHPCPIKEESQIVLTKPSMTQTVRLIYLEQGIKGFFKGVTMNWVKGPIAFSISFTTYDAIKSWIEGNIDQDRRVHES